jgi:hypothetical protein
MCQENDAYQRTPIILPIDDPFDTEYIRLAGSSPSLRVEAEIAVRQWNAENSAKPNEEAARCAIREKGELNRS